MSDLKQLVQQLVIQDIFPRSALTTHRNDALTKIIAAMVNATENKALLGRLGCIYHLLTFLNDCDSGIQCKSVSAIALLAEVEENRSTISSYDGILALINLLNSTNNVALHEKGACALANLAVSVALCSKIRTSGGIPLLVKLLQSACIEVQMQSSHALLNLASFDLECQQLLMEREVLNLIIERLISDKVQENMVTLIVLLTSTNSHFQLTVASNGGIPILVTILSSKFANIQAKAAHALGNLAMSPRTHSKIISCEAIPSLIKLMGSTISNVSCKAAFALAKLCVEDKIKSHIASQFFAIFPTSTTSSEGEFHVLLEILKATPYSQQSKASTPAHVAARFYDPVSTPHSLCVTASSSSSSSSSSSFSSSDHSALQRQIDELKAKCAHSDSRLAAEMQKSGKAEKMLAQVEAKCLSAEKRATTAEQALQKEISGPNHMPTSEELRHMTVQNLKSCEQKFKEALNEIEKIKTDQSLCNICLEAPKVVIFLPCKHKSVCAECSKTLNKCPICRAAIIDKIVPFE